MGLSAGSSVLAQIRTSRRRAVWTGLQRCEEGTVSLQPGINTQNRVPGCKQPGYNVSKNKLILAFPQELRTLLERYDRLYSNKLRNILSIYPGSLHQDLYLIQ